MGEVIVKNIKRIMEEKGLGVYSLTNKGVYPSQNLQAKTIYKVLNHKNPTVKTIEKIANALGVHWSELVKEVG